MDFLVNSRKIYSQINQAQNILVAVHQNPDADALGSMAAFCFLLEDLGKNYTMFCLNQPDENLAWIINFESVVTKPEKLFEQDYDLVLVLDSGDLEYAGLKGVLPSFKNPPVVVNIDHHITNLGFGDINLVDPKAVSATEIIYRFFKLLKIKVSSKMASVLLAGIIGDTYNFTNSNTNPACLEIASQLLLAGARLDQVNDSIFKNKSVEVLKIWGEILVRLTYNQELEIASTVVTADNLKDHLSVSDVTDGVANFLNNISGVKAALILQQYDSQIVKGSFRTNEDLIDVSKLARMLGGGGHRKAAGFKIKGKLIEVDGAWKIV